jgi:hypothetical protein
MATIHHPNTLKADFLPVRVFLPHQVPRRAAEARNYAETRLPDDSVAGKALIDSGSLGGRFPQWRHAPEVGFYGDDNIKKIIFSNVAFFLSRKSI